MLKINGLRIGKKCLSLLACISFVFTLVLPPSYAQTLMGKDLAPLPEPGKMVALSSTINPPVLRGIKVYTNDPLKFDFILDPGDKDRKAVANGTVDPEIQAKLKETSNRLLKYFLTTLTVPDNDIWVNLSPYEKNRIIPESFGQTEMGRDVLGQDYLLKQITASLMFPEGEAGKKFWARIYKEAKKRFGSTQIPVNTFNKVWIMPDKAVVYEKLGDNQATAFVIESRLKVMLESDYIAKKKAEATRLGAVQRAPLTDAQKLSEDIAREVMIPVLEKEVNEGENFAPLRQVYGSILLALWYKDRMKNSILSSAYVNRNKVAGVNVEDKAVTQKIWQQYVNAYKKGAFNFIREEEDTTSRKVIPRKYFSGGFALPPNRAQLTEYVQTPGIFTRSLRALASAGLVLVSTAGKIWANPVTETNLVPLQSEEESMPLSSVKNPKPIHIVVKNEPHILSYNITEKNQALTLRQNYISQSAETSGAKASTTFTFDPNTGNVTVTVATEGAGSSSNTYSSNTLKGQDSLLNMMTFLLDALSHSHSIRNTIQLKKYIKDLVQTSGLKPGLYIPFNRAQNKKGLFIAQIGQKLSIITTGSSRSSIATFNFNTLEIDNTPVGSSTVVFRPGTPEAEDFLIKTIKFLQRAQKRKNAPDLGGIISLLNNFGIMQPPPTPTPIDIRITNEPYILDYVISETDGVLKLTQNLLLNVPGISADEFDTFTFDSNTGNITVETVDIGGNGLFGSSSKTYSSSTVDGQNQLLKMLTSLLDALAHSPDHADQLNSYIELIQDSGVPPYLYIPFNPTQNQKGYFITDIGGILNIITTTSEGSSTTSLNLNSGVINNTPVIGSPTVTYTPGTPEWLSFLNSLVASLPLPDTIQRPEDAPYPNLNGLAVLLKVWETNFFPAELLLYPYFPYSIWSTEIAFINTQIAKYTNSTVPLEQSLVAVYKQAESSIEQALVVLENGTIADLIYYAKVLQDSWQNVHGMDLLLQRLKTTQGYQQLSLTGGTPDNQIPAEYQSSFINGNRFLVQGPGGVTTTYYVLFLSFGQLRYPIIINASDPNIKSINMLIDGLNAQYQGSASPADILMTIKALEMASNGQPKTAQAPEMNRPDSAMKGGIDLNRNSTPLDVRNKGGTVIFHIDPAQIERINAATGLTPQVFTVDPLQSLPAFLGMSKEEAEQIEA